MPIKVLMPALSPTMTEGTLAKWLVKEGDSVSSGDLLAEIETDKATMEVEAIEDGVVGKLLVAEGTEGVPVNQLIAVLLEEGEDESALDGIEADGAAAPPASAPKKEEEKQEKEKAEEKDKAAAAPEKKPAPQPETSGATNGAGTQQAVPTGNGDGRIFASPLARRMARQANLDLAALRGSGPHGRIIKADIDAAVAGGGTAPAAPTARPSVPGVEGPAYEDLRPSTMRKVIAQRMTEAARDIPHIFITVDCEIDRLLAARREINDASAGAYKVSVNDLVIKAAALALRRVPDANVSWTGDAIRRYNAVDVSVAVAIESGLITPIIRNADLKGLATISEEMRELAGRAKGGKLMPEEYQGGTFTVSNLGMFGVSHFTAIINPPQACILAVGAGQERAVVRDGSLAVATVMSCTLSCDHRVVDGALGARYLQALKTLIESPAAMLA